jgi:hypothetical protein
MKTLFLFILFFSFTTKAGIDWCNFLLTDWPPDQETAGQALAGFKAAVEAATDQGKSDPFEDGPRLQKLARDVFQATNTQYHPFIAEGLLPYEVDLILAEEHGSALNRLAFEMQKINPQATLYYSAALLLMNRTPAHVAWNVLRFYLPHDSIVRPDPQNYYLATMLGQLELQADIAAGQELSFLEGQAFPTTHPTFVNPPLERHPDLTLSQGLAFSQLRDHQRWIDFLLRTPPFYLRPEERLQSLREGLPPLIAAQSELLKTVTTFAQKLEGPFWVNMIPQGPPHYRRIMGFPGTQVVLEFLIPDPLTFRLDPVRRIDELYAEKLAQLQDWLITQLASNQKAWEELSPP